MVLVTLNVSGFSGIGGNFVCAIVSFKNAFACDPVSAFGGVIACNYKINKKLAFEINKNFIEVIMAKGYDAASLRILKKKKKI